MEQGFTVLLFLSGVHKISEFFVRFTKRAVVIRLSGFLAFDTT